MSGMGYSMPPYPPLPENEQTVDAGLRRDVEFLKRRPGPRSDEAYFRAWQTTGHPEDSGAPFNVVGQNITTNVQETLTWDLWETDYDHTIFEIANDPDPTPGSSTFTDVILLQPGLYSFHLLVAYWDSFNAKCTLGYRVLGYGSWPLSSRTAEYDATSADAGGLIMHDETILPPPDLENLHAVVYADDTPYEGANPSMGTCNFLVIQESGIDRRILSSEMHIRYKRILRPPLPQPL